MSLTQKPFVCYHKGCEMTFTNVDHLHVHKKKHKMALHLGIDNQNSNLGADQTPTPTRFIRNCEEVGLFQDLQNVNPFEETFRKATELVKSGSLHLPKKATDDTLHTPHFSPSIDDKIINNYNKCCESNSEKKEPELTIVAVKIDSTANNLNKIHHLTSNELVLTKLDNNKQVSVKESDSSTTNSNIQELRKTVMDTLKLKLQNSASTNDIVKVTPVKANRNKSQAKSKINKNGSVTKTKQDRTREINRYAQFRSRQKKKSWILQMETDIEDLKKSKNELCVENQNLKNEVTLLKSMLLFHKDCSASKNPKIIEKVNTLLKKSQENVINTPPIKVTPVKQVKPLQPRVATITLLPNAIFLPLALNSVNGTSQQQESTSLPQNSNQSAKSALPQEESDDMDRPASANSSDSLEILVIDDE